MQLLDSEQLEYAFQLHGITLEAKARQFYADIWRTIQAAEKARDQKAVLELEKELRGLCNAYFSAMHEWRQEEEERHENTLCCALSRENAREADTDIPLFEKQFFRYAMCYLELNRALIRSRAQLSSLARDYDVENLAKMPEVNHGTGALLARAHKERQMMTEKRMRIERARSLLTLSDSMMEELGAGLPRRMKAEGDRQLTLFKGALRKSEFARAEQIALSWKNKHLSATGKILTAVIQKNAPELAVQDGLMLHSGELSLVSASLKGDEARVNDFLSKHNVPYLVFQYKNLIRLGYLLGRLGSIEGLIIQHAKLMSLAARPHNDVDYAKAQQQTVLIPVRSMLQSSFPTLGPIFEDMETTLIVLDRLFKQTRDSMVHPAS